MPRSRARKSLKRKASVENGQVVNNNHLDLLKKRKDTSAQSFDFECYQKKLNLIEKGFHLSCPLDFLIFFEFCKYLDANKPLEVFYKLGLQLVGPFEVLEFDDELVVEDGQWTNYYRYFHDPPEFITLITNLVDGFHIGYYRDFVESNDCFVVKSVHNISGKLSYTGQNLFAVLKQILKVNSSQFSKHVLQKLNDFVELHNLNDIDKSNESFSLRKKQVVCATMNDIGLVVHTSGRNIGYRPLSVSYRELTKLLEDVANAPTEDDQLNKFDPICSLISYAQFANDEGDYGQSLELGLSMIAFRPKSQSLEKCSLFNRDIKRLLSVGYKLGGRSKFADVIERHMNDRRLEPVTFSNSH